MDKKCAPSKKYTDGSCFTLDALHDIARKYNEKNKQNKIDYKSLSKKKLVAELNTKLSNVCSEQTCWLNIDFIKELDDSEINNNTFRPVGPNKRYEWLNTLHINEVIKQYHELYPDFIFLGAVPSDFEEVPMLGLHNIDFKKFEDNNKKIVTLVINLDEHYQSGSHWVGLYMDLSKYQIYYIDSVGKKPIFKIKKFITKAFKYMYQKKFNKQFKMRSVKKSTDELNEIDIRYNNLQHQYKNTECGVYSIYFILELLKGKSFDDIVSDRVPDNIVNQFRSHFFRNVNF